MICSTILIDTFNFDPKLKDNRWVEKDKIQYDHYKSEGFIEDDVYRALNNLKYDKDLNL